MRYKLDENLGPSIRQVFSDAGHDVDTVVDEALQGTDDRTLFDRAIHEGRCLVTLDLDFADSLRFRVPHGSGIVVLRPPHRASLPTLVSMVRALVLRLQDESPLGELWIVEPGRIRIHQPTLDREQE